MREEQVDKLIESLERGTLAMEGYIKTSQALCEAQKALADMKAKQVERMYQVIIEGNGRDPLIYTVDRHERTLSNQSKVLWIVISLFIAQVFYGLWQHFIAGG